jgi:hypothetical protein
MFGAPIPELPEQSASGSDAKTPAMLHQTCH